MNLRQSNDRDLMSSLSFMKQSSRRSRATLRPLFFLSGGDGIIARSSDCHATNPMLKVSCELKMAFRTMTPADIGAQNYQKCQLLGRQNTLFVDEAGNTPFIMNDKSI